MFYTEAQLESLIKNPCLFIVVANISSSLAGVIKNKYWRSAKLVNSEQTSNYLVRSYINDMLYAITFQKSNFTLQIDNSIDLRRQRMLHERHTNTNISAFNYLDNIKFRLTLNDQVHYTARPRHL